MYYIVRCADGSYVDNKFIYDSNDESIEFINEFEYEKVNEVVGIGAMVLKPKDGMLARLVVSTSKYYIMKTDDLNLYITYGLIEKNKWYIVIEIVSNLIITIQPKMLGDAKGFYWHYSSDIKCYAELPEGYVEYLVKNEKAKKRECKKILSCTQFRWGDFHSGIHVTKGISFINKLKKGKV